MGEPRPFAAEKLVVGVLISELSLREELHALLQASLGPLDYVSPTLPFTHTSYYDAEMGTPILRYFLSFADLVDPQTLPRLKIDTGAVERRFRWEGGRRVNLDPGILSLSRFVLASTKDSAHRIPLQEGIFGEVTLLFRASRFHPLPWTYPDYRSEAYQQILLEIRRRLKAQTRGGRGYSRPSEPRPR
jgi:hypothetical protein